MPVSVTSKIGIKLTEIGPIFSLFTLKKLIRNRVG